MAENQPKRRGRPAKVADSATATSVPAEVSEAATEAPITSESASAQKVQSARKQIAFESLEAYLKYLAEEKRNGR
ncbi:hypothetical protein NP1_1 [Xanthomonas phage NP1]|nr:hypothetical protein NP1_1 [Xanthomonas phage NP1]